MRPLHRVFTLLIMLVSFAGPGYSIAPDLTQNSTPEHDVGPEQALELVAIVAQDALFSPQEAMKAPELSKEIVISQNLLKTAEIALNDQKVFVPDKSRRGEATLTAQHLTHNRNARDGLIRLIA